ncbi:BMC domain-containing protein [Oleidesulfovibrio alaskensis]|jgi:microcompartment protein CcmL/EutN
MTALGLIETKGLLAAVEAADAMLKAADVRLLEKNLASGGLVTITVAGEVSAVRAAVDAGVSAIRRVNAASLVSEHVIARPDEGVSRVVSLVPPAAVPPAAPPVQAPAGDSGAQQPVQEAAEAEPQTGTTVEEQTPAAVEATPAPAAAAPRTETVRYEISQLKKMNVSRLRQVARGVSGLSIPREAVKSANKKDLIDAIINSYRQIEE